MKFNDYSEEMKQLAEKTNWIADELEMAKARDQRDKTYDFWKTLRKVNNEYQNLDVMGEGTFREYLEYHYGVRIYLNEAGQIQANYDVVDEQLFLIFKLKHT